jgi:hypothetical protein
MKTLFRQDIKIKRERERERERERTRERERERERENTRRVSGITFIRYAQNRKIGKLK